VENSRISIGVAIALIVAGVLFLLRNFGILGPVINLVWIVLFAAGGVTFLWVYAANHERWWAIIPGFALLGLAAVIGFGETLGALAGWCQNNRIGVTTAGAIRALGYKVEITRGKGFHATVVVPRDWSPAAARRLAESFEDRENPVARAERHT